MRQGAAPAGHPPRNRLLETAGQKAVQAATVRSSSSFATPSTTIALYFRNDISTEAAHAASKSRHRPDRCRRHRRRNRRSPSRGSPRHAGARGRSSRRLHREDDGRRVLRGHQLRRRRRAVSRAREEPILRVPRCAHGLEARDASPGHVHGAHGRAGESEEPALPADRGHRSPRSRSES